MRFVVPTGDKSSKRSRSGGLSRGATFAPGRGGSTGRLGLAGWLIVACALVSVLVALYHWSNSGRIYRGVEAGGVDVGGKTLAEAEEMLRSRVGGGLGEIELAGSGGASLSAEDLGVDYDVVTSLEAAYAVGREGNLFEQARGRFGAAVGAADVPLETDYRPEVARDRVEEMARRMEERPRNATIEIRGSEVEVVEARKGYDLDVAATARSVDEAIRNASGDARLVGETLEPRITTAEAGAAAKEARRAMSGPLVLSYGGKDWTIEPAEIGTALEVRARDGDLRVSLRKGGLGAYMGGMYEDLAIAPKEAGFEVRGGEVKVTPGEAGRKIEDKKFFEALKSGIFEGERRYEIPVAKDESDLTTAEAQRLKPTDLLGEYSTNYLTYDDTPGRVANLKLASNAVDGTALAPGEVFSFNELAEPLDYYDTKVIVRGRVDTAEGGGLCQVSSTLYMAANYAGMETVERQPHYAELPYIRPGFDATVWFGAIDYKFRNNTDSYVLVRERVDETTGDVRAEIWGRPTGKQVEMSSRKVGEWEDEEGNPVTRWVTYQTVTKNGEVLRDGVLHTDTYKYLKPAEEDAPYDERPVN